MESHGQAFVELVDDKCSYGCGDDISFVDMIIESSWSGEYHMGLGLDHCPVLVHCRSAAIYGHGPYPTRHVA